MPFLAFLGEDQFQRDEALEAARRKWSDAVPGEGAGRELFFCGETGWETVAESYETVSMFAARKTIHLRDIGDLKLEDQASLAKVFATPNDSALVLADGEKWDARSALRKFFTKNGKLTEYKKPYSNQVPDWLVRRAQARYARRLEGNGARLLADLVGEDLMELDGELQKLDSFAAPGKPITGADIEASVAPRRERSIWELQDAMGRRSRARALQALANLPGSEPPFLVAILLFSHFLQLLRVREEMERGTRSDDIPAALGISGYYYSKQGYADQARSRTAAEWRAALIRLAELEAEFKQGRHTRRFEIEFAFVGLL